MQVRNADNEHAGAAEDLPRAEPRSERAWRLAFLAAASVVVVIALLMALRPLVQPTVPGGDHYVYLARHLAQGNLNVDDLPGTYADYLVWQGHKYLPFELLPALLLVPFLPLLGVGLPLVSITELLSLLNVWLFYRVLGRAGMTGERRKWSLLLFFGGTVYFSTILEGTGGNSWLFAHVVATGCLLLALHEALGKGRAVPTGLLLGLAGMTRLTTLFALPLFVWLLWRRRASSNAGGPGRGPALELASAAMGVLAGLVVPLVAIGLYNYSRFGNPLESGYALALLYNPVLEQARSYGLFSPVHIPKNLFMLLFQGPLPYPSEDAPVLQFPYAVPSEWGMGIFFTSPALLYAFRARLKEPLVQACWLGVASVGLILITYYGIGWVQFGYRYALDFLPFMLILAARGMSDPLSNRARALVLASFLINLWGTLLISNRL